MLKRGPYSNSRIGLCPEQFKKKYIDKEEGIRSTLFGTSNGLAAHELTDLFLKGKVSTVPEFLATRPEFNEFESALTESFELFKTRFTRNEDNFVGSEEQLAVNEFLEPVSFNGEDAWYRGVIDYLEIDDNLHARVVDYKNYPIIHNPSDLTDLYHGIPRQMMGYALLVFAAYPVESVELEIYYLRYGVSRHVSHQVNGQWVKRIITRDVVPDWWESCKRRIRVWEERDEFPPHPSAKQCQYCEYTHSCSYMASKAPQGPLLSHDDAKEALGSLIVMDESRKRLNERVKQYAEHGGTIELESGASYGPVASIEVSYDVPNLIEILGDDAPNVLRVDKRALTKYLKGADSKIADKVAETETHTMKTRLKKS